MVNTYREPGMQKYWVPSNVESAVFGTKITDHFFPVNIGGDIGFLNGVLKHLAENDWLDHAFIADRTEGFDEALEAVRAQSWEELEALSGSTKADMYDLARLLGEAKSAVLVWSMGVTQHTYGEDNVRSIVNLALARGFLGRDHRGLMPIRGTAACRAARRWARTRPGCPAACRSPRRTPGSSPTCGASTCRWSRG